MRCRLWRAFRTFITTLNGLLFFGGCVGQARCLDFVLCIRMLCCPISIMCLFGFVVLFLFRVEILCFVRDVRAFDF